MSAAALLGLAHVGLARWAGRGAPSGRLSGQRCGLPLLRGWGSWPVSPSSQPVGQPLVQRLHWLASLGDLDGAQAAMDELTPGCVGFDTFPPPVTARTPSGVPHVSYVHLFSDAAFSMGIFVLPAGAKIPLHDHPEMTVLSKLLYGTLQVTSYDTGELVGGLAGAGRGWGGEGGDMSRSECDVHFPPNAPSLHQRRRCA